MHLNADVVVEAHDLLAQGLVELAHDGVNLAQSRTAFAIGQAKHLHHRAEDAKEELRIPEVSPVLHDELDGVGLEKNPGVGTSVGAISSG